MDFHTSFRKLCFLQPSHVRDVVYLQGFTSDLIAATTTGLSSESLNAAIHDLSSWLGTYAKRVQQPAEVEVWTSTEVPTSKEDQTSYGEATSGDGWEAKRETMMKRVNPRFVLRQWVLEEAISELERTGVAKIQEGRRILAKILDVSLITIDPTRALTDDV